MDDQKTALEKLPVLKDDPLFWGVGGYDPSQDAFNHEAYARAILKILTENKPPISVGLFGPWGIGKSTIVSILLKLIDQQDRATLKPIYFNAWKYSGDSFRRQFLIEVAKKIYENHPDHDAKIHRLEQLNYTDVLREDAHKSLAEQVKELLGAKVRLREPGLARILLALIVLLVGVAFGAFTKSVYPFLSTIFPALLLFFLRLKFEDLFVIQENTVYDPKLIFPEQFEAEFRKLIDPGGPLGASTPVIIVDDIDRCEGATIRDILISIKTFIGQEHCFFLVPCDDRSIVQVFQDPNQKSGYQDELLRKYFNVGIRIAPLMATDLVDFANSISKKSGMPLSVVQIAILANYRDARKMIHFLNTFAVKYSIAKARQKSGFMPIDIDQNLPGFAKAVLIEDLYPALFARMVERPEIYEILERAALVGEPTDHLKNFGLEKWYETYPGLLEILEKTRDIKIEHIEVFLSLKTTNPESRIQGGFDLKNSIVRGDAASVESASKGVSTDQARSALADLLLDLLAKTTDTFLKNTVSSSLEFYAKGGFLLASDKPRLARSICQALIYDEGQKALQQRAASALQCAKDAGGGFPNDLLAKYRKELGELDQPVDGIEETINALYEHENEPQLLSAVLNKKFDQWVGTDKGLSILTKLRLPKELKPSNVVPSAPVREKIAALISTDNNPTAQAANDIRKEILFRHWDKQAAAVFAERLVAILQQGASDTAYTPRISFVVHAIIENHDTLESKYGPQLWTQVQGLHSRLGDASARLEVHKAILVFAATFQDAGVRGNASAFALQNWQTFDDVQLRTTLEFLSGFKAEARLGLRTIMIQQEFNSVQAELQNPTDRTKQRLALCFENKEVLASNAIDDRPIKALEVQDSAFSVWRVAIGDYAPRLGAGFSKQVAEKCLSLVTNSHTPQRRQLFFELFATVLPVLDADEKVRLLPGYFVLCKHADQSIRNSASTVLGKLRTELNEQDFKLHLNSLARDLCRMTPTEVMAFRAVLDAALQHSILFEEYTWRDLADLAKRALPQADAAIQDFGLSLVERMSKIPPDHESDVVHLLVGVAHGPNGTLKGRADKVLRKIPESELGAKARDTLQGYLSPPEREEKAQ